LSGFKGGALNFLLEKTDADTDVVAIVDSDYQVESDWLKLLFFFSDPGLAVIQAPQDYRDKDSFFKELCYFEYKSFFNTGMVIRDHFNALILHGTMTLIRANVLRKLGWAEWCVCEDAELGLRVLIDKHKMKYVQISYGQGVMPDRFGDYKRQRARWVAGAIQILVRHSSSIFTLKTELSWRQKYQFFMGWAHWLVQPASLLTTLVVMLWSIIVLCLPTHDFDYPALVSVSLISAFILTLVAQALLYIRYSPDGRHGAMLSIIASQALNYIVAITVVRVLFSHPKNFVVTPKMAGHLRAPSFPMDCLGELVIFLIITALAGFIAFSETDKPYPALWALMLILRGIPYGLAALMSIFSQQQDPDLESDAR
jgi:cellulose synthase/poly-beta-1,6-N-acetylglucosamine synthase-like glycosyltransferase